VIFFLKIDLSRKVCYKCTRLLLCRLVCLVGNSVVEKRRLEEEAGNPHRETKTLKRREQARRTRGVKGRYSMNRYDK